MQNDVARLVQCNAEERPGLQFIRVTWHAAVVYHMGPHGHVKTVRVMKPEMKRDDIVACSLLWSCCSEALCRVWCGDINFGPSCAAKVLV